MRLFDVSGQAVLAKSGFASWTAEYDARGNLTRQDFYDAAGNRTELKEGFASWIAEHDERGRIDCAALPGRGRTTLPDNGRHRRVEMHPQ